MTPTEQLLAEQKRTNDLLKILVDKISISPILTGLVSLEDACNIMGWTKSTGRHKLAYLRNLGKLTRPEGNPNKYYVTELEEVKMLLREKQICMKYYNKKAA